jgi:hypothetical protein
MIGDVTMLRVHRQLEAAQRRSEHALALAQRGRIAIERSIEEQHELLEAVRTGCPDVDLGPVLIDAELRLLHLLRELERFEREVHQPAEEVHRFTTARIAAFEEQLAKNRAESTSGFRTRPVSIGRILRPRPETTLA